MFTLIRWDSGDYKETLFLRNQVLKVSAGQPLIKESPVEEKQDIHLVARQDERIVGTLLLHPCSSKSIQVKQVALHPDYQRQGLGKNLINYAEQIARNLNYSTLFLTGRKQAWGFYRRLGYGETEAYQTDALILKIFKKDLLADQYFFDRKEMKTNG
ncbi:GNAT family N-acetyltransferase [Enterococcus casseliflavus]|nr:GNAT family N-acetyltransferase [Enterococcus casseliflavus]MBF0014405.1 GNAT family N-acetyltransferase [Enterococcus casseliflavus]